MGPPIIICKAEHNQISFWQYVLRSFLFEGSRPAGILMYKLNALENFILSFGIQNFLKKNYLFFDFVCLLQTWLN